MYPTFKKYVHRLLTDNNILIRFVDVGSRNGILDLSGVARFVDAYGFEPNPDEYQKLITNKTDASKFGIKSPNYHSISYSPKAVSDKIGRSRFFITHGPGACGLGEPNIDRLKEIHWKGGAYKTNFANDVFDIEKVIDVDVETLENFSKTKSFDYVDYLKIDVEGAEYEVLMGAGDLLNRIGVIKVEICFFPFRKDQKLFSDVDVYLRKYGFELLRYEISPAQIGFKERTDSWDFGPQIGVPERYGQPLSGDAIYVNRNITDPKRALAQGIILLEKNYLDEALHILHTKTDIKMPELFELLKTFRGQWRTRFISALFRLGRQLVRSPHLWK